MVNAGDAGKQSVGYNGTAPQGHGTCVSQPDKTGVIAANPLPRVKTLHKG